MYLIDFFEQNHFHEKIVYKFLIKNFDDIKQVYNAFGHFKTAIHSEIVNVTFTMVEAER